MKSTCIEAVKTNKLIAVARGIELKSILPVAQALYDGGVRLLEVTINQGAGEKAGTEEAVRAIHLLNDAFGGRLLIGAGTVMTPSQVSAVVRAGASFIVSPNTDAQVVRRTKSLDVVSIPGAMTPSEIAYAYRLGADFVKVFPANSFPAGYFKAIRAPLGHIPMIAVGGVDIGNAPGYLRAGMTAVSVGSGILRRDLIAAEQYAEITAIAERYTEVVK